ncbi:MAG TPA: sulfatase-like hydrolase/transferase [Opitutaceae bacterium]|nr:sulfatase-like hydrolase/transferase [Opitutaceae bacterium]
MNTFGSAFRHPRLNVLGLLLAVLGVLTGSHHSALRAAESGRPPNIIFILVDDLGTDWVGCYGSPYPTPSLDRLAARGLQFDTAWTSPICTPSRVMMLTGLYPGRTGWTEHYDVPRWGGEGLIPDRFDTWPQRLKRHGYATAIAGKWQINDLRLSADILQRHGFDHHCVWPGVESNNPPSEQRYWDAYLQTDGVRKVHRGAYGPDVTQAFALDFIRQKRSGPFVLYYPMILVHAPNEPTPRNRHRPPSGEDALYAGSVTYMDQQVGELLDELDRLALTDNTVIIFAGDNGSSSSGTLHGRSIPAGKGKTTAWGVHVPLIVSAPGIATVSGKRTAALTDFSDLYPSILELAGLSPPSGLAIDGHSWVPLLKGTHNAATRPWIYAQRHTDRTIRDERYKLNSDGNLFDLLADPDERTPLDARSSQTLSDRKKTLSTLLAAIPAANVTMPFPEYSLSRMKEYQDQMAKERKATKSERKRSD